MKTITITAHNRPQYLKQVLESLKQNDLRGYDKLYCALEPGCPENVELCKKIDFIQKEIVVNSTKLGVRINPFNILSHVFDLGSDFNVYLEDDSILSPDAFTLANFYQKHPMSRTSLCMCFYNYNSDETKPEKIVVASDFVALGFALTRSQWKEYFQKYWNDEEFRKEQKIDMGGIGGWDWCIRAVMKCFHLYPYAPAFNRSMHIGREGTHCDAQTHDRMFGDKKYNLKKVRKFEL